MAQVEPRESAIGKPGQNVVWHTTPTTAKIQDVVAILDAEFFNHVVNHVHLGLLEIGSSFLPQSHAVFWINQFSVAQHPIQHALWQVVLDLHQIS